MAARRGNKAWLRQQLAKALKWDADTAEGVVEAVAAAGSQEEVDALVEAYMGGDASAANLVHQFRGPPTAAAGQPPPGPPAPGMQLYQRDSEMRQLESSLRGGGGSSAGAGGAAAGSSSGAGGSGRGRAAPQAVELSPPAAADKAKPLLDMGRNVAVTVKPARKKGSGGEAGSSSSGGGSATKSLAKPVVNCLSCGKIYDCRSMSDEALRFLESGGICTFCGKRVMLRYDDGSTNMGGDEAEAAAGPSSAAGAAASSAGGELAGFKPEAQQGNAADAVAYNDSQAAAVALKDRLVEYDRQSAKRTTVLDDQSDFFEIDANAWLTDEERAVLKQRERELAEAEEARRRRVMVTFDLLGRKVIVDGSADGSDEAAAAAEAAAVAAQLDAARAAAAAKALAATSAEAAQGGGAAAPTALAAVEDKLRDLRITVNPSMAARHFVFLPQQQQQGQQQQGQQPAARVQQQQQQQQAQGAGGAAAGAGQQSGGRGGSGGNGQRPRKPARNGGGISRLQHDDPFLGFEEVQVLAGDEAGRHVLEAAAGAAQAVAS
ncbi:activating signal cointegrator 1 isoform A [Chlorella sorokiniana]|uniref:Activating signal cointegrator 1 isoform A n=1 Tax=Chlorella sorokiniana TaxID=3076 RepID=A0A2P6U0P6_CHLSO|nr:activating signal cointegrator 1 isoform B [Chlorella sorokiniana]PRW59892.1 activating signal cointegrator 1 isoform C [Chlorella sorokiniana]PRW59893.1 activating signal cointegrator 1 isoform A [Chlorella sorokiniana]|eukprot:PRW59891.1 activating signal cointegrator 1 isoform B [Chlorella sorokiniana]